MPWHVAFCALKKMPFAAGQVAWSLKSLKSRPGGEDGLTWPESDWLDSGAAWGCTPVAHWWISVMLNQPGTLWGEIREHQLMCHWIQTLTIKRSSNTTTLSPCLEDSNLELNWHGNYLLILNFSYASVKQNKIVLYESVLILMAFGWCPPPIFIDS